MRLFKSITQLKNGNSLCHKPILILGVGNYMLLKNPDGGFDFT
jgi:hypothetical protein